MGSMSYIDDLISPQLQSLIKKVYQECSRIITSKYHATASNRPQDGTIPLDRQHTASANPPMSWQQEQWTPQETVIALRELLCRLAQRQSQSDGGDDWHWDQLYGRVESELKAELEESKKQLKCAHDAQQEQNKKISSFRLALDEGEEALKREQNRVQELQQQLERERAVSLRKDREVEERRGAWQVLSEQQRIEVVALKGQVEQERVVCSNLRQELQIEQSRSMLLQNRLEETQKELEDERQQWNETQEVSVQEKTHLERLLSEAESRSAENHSKLSDVQRKLDDVIDRCSRQVDELSHRHEADAARDKKFISDLCVQLEQERRQGEELASEMDRLRAEFLQSKRKWEEEDRVKREELDREREAAVQQRAALEALKEQKHEANHALEVEQERFRCQGAELAELKERLQQLKNKERQMEEQWQRERKKVMQEQMERERRQERTNNKLCELELLRQQDQQRMQELQRTLVELEREAREMAAQRLNGQTIGTDSMQTNQQMSTPRLMETLLKENAELTEHVTSLSQERTVLQHRLTCLERKLRRTELELAKLKTETENMPVSDMTSNSKVQRLYGRYLRAESFRKALIYQKRYLLLLLGGFQDCEQATLCLIANMGVRPSPPLSSQHTPRGRFRVAVLAVVAISRMKFLNRKWHLSINRVFPSVTVNEQAAGCKVEVLRQQQPKVAPNLSPNRESNVVRRDAVSALVPPTKSPFRLHNRSYSSLASGHSGETSHPEQSLTDYIHHLERVQHRLMGVRQVSETHLAPPPKEERRIQSACSPDMIGHRQRWLQENRTWLYLSCLSPLYLNGAGSSALQRDPKTFDDVM